MRLKGKVAIITGGGSGIGRGTALLFSKEGAKVIIVDINVEGGNETVDMIRNIGGEAMSIKADVSNSVDVKKMVKAAVVKYSKLDILFNNAGIGPPGNDTVTDIMEEEWDRVIDVNLKGIFLCSKYAIPEMIKNGGGSVINTASVNGLIGSRKHSAYCASKGGVVMLTKAMALDYAPYNIRVNCICPGIVFTPLIQRTFSALEKPEFTSQITRWLYPLRRFGKPEDIAYAALYLSSDESSFVTGSTLIVDGGLSAQRLTRRDSTNLVKFVQSLSDK